MQRVQSGIHFYQKVHQIVLFYISNFGRGKNTTFYDVLRIVRPARVWQTMIENSNAKIARFFDNYYYKLYDTFLLCLTYYQTLNTRCFF